MEVKHMMTWWHAWSPCRQENACIVVSCEHEEKIAKASDAICNTDPYDTSCFNIQYSISPVDVPIYKTLSVGSRVLGYHHFYRFNALSGRTSSAMPRLDSRTWYSMHNRYAVHQGLLDWNYTHTGHESCSERIAGHENNNNMIPSHVLHGASMNIVVN
jgi:hypothetical protein